MCVVCESTLSDYRSYDLSRHYKKHQAEIEEKQKLVSGSELRKYCALRKRKLQPRGKICSQRRVVIVQQCSKYPTKLPSCWLKKHSLSLTVKKLLSSVSKNLHNMLVIKV